MRRFHSLYHLREHTAAAPVIEIEVEIVRPKMGKTLVERLHEPRPARVRGNDLRHEEEAAAVVGANRLPDQRLRTSIAVHLRRVDEGHPRLDSRAQCLHLARVRLN